jgi:hypothetical protein
MNWGKFSLSVEWKIMLLFVTESDYSQGCLEEENFRENSKKKKFKNLVILNRFFFEENSQEIGEN